MQQTTGKYRKQKKQLHAVQFAGSQKAYVSALPELSNCAEVYIEKAEDAFEKIVSVIDGPN